MLLGLLFLLFVSISKADPLRRLVEPITENSNQTRRILRGRHAGSTRPYMVYLRQATPGPPPADPHWLCGGVIIHPRYVLTSAACIQDVSCFYVISGTRWWTPMSNKTDTCVINGARKAVAKSIPKNYIYDGSDFNNIRWMANDIAIVKVDEEFNFKKRVRGCSYIPQMIAYNNQSEELEKPRTEASIAGWGSRDKFSEVGISASDNSRNLLEARVFLMSKKNCKKRWPERYHYIIDGNMICARDDVDTDFSNLLCKPNDGKCTEPEYSYEDQTKKASDRRAFEDPESMIVHSAAHMNGSRRFGLRSGGFCENDHGGPLVVGRGKRSVVAGVISACLMKEATQKCHGPFLFTSVWQNRHLINCVINDETGYSKKISSKNAISKYRHGLYDICLIKGVQGETCQNLFESRKIGVEQTQFDWSSIPAGHSKMEFNEEDVKERAEIEDADESKAAEAAAVKNTLTPKVNLLEIMRQGTAKQSTKRNLPFIPSK